MYARYTRTPLAAGCARYQFEEQISLFGCNNGFITWLVRNKLPANPCEPYQWHVNVLNELGNMPKYRNNTLLIDLKPKQSKANTSLYEVLDVWGYSDCGWTPILLRLQGLLVDASPDEVDRNDFTRHDEDIDGPIYEFMYLAGSVANGKLVGKWSPPPMSPTNAALLWPKPLNYFVQCMQQTTPDVFQQER